MMAPCQRVRALAAVTLMMAATAAVAEQPAAETTGTTTAAWAEVAPGVRWREVTPGRGRSPQAGDKVFMHINTYLDNGPLFHTTRGSRMPVGHLFGDGQMPAAFDAAIAAMKEQGRREIEFAPEAEYRTQRHLSEGDQFSTSALVRLDVVLLWLEPARGRANAAASTSGGGETP